MKKEIIKSLALFFLLLIVIFRLGLWNAGKAGITETQYWAFLWLQFKWVWGTAGVLFLAWGVICLCYAAAENIVKRRREQREEAAEDLELRQHLERVEANFQDVVTDRVANIAEKKVGLKIRTSAGDVLLRTADNTEFLKKQPPKAADSDISNEPGRDRVSEFLDKERARRSQRS